MQVEQEKQNGLNNSGLGDDGVGGVIIDSTPKKNPVMGKQKTRKIPRLLVDGGADNSKGNGSESSSGNISRESEGGWKRESPSNQDTISVSKCIIESSKTMLGKINPSRKESASVIPPTRKLTEKQIQRMQLQKLRSAKSVDLLMKANIQTTYKPNTASQNNIGPNSSQTSNSEQFLTSRHVQNLKKRVGNAIGNKKIFIIDGNFDLLRNALVRRGWVQKLLPRDNKIRMKMLKHYEDVLMSRLLIGQKPNFIWTKLNFNKLIFRDNPYYSRLIARNFDSNYSNKAGLNMIYNRLHWFETTDLMYPRTYTMNENGEEQAFLKDFRLTYCTNFLYYLIKQQEMKTAFSVDGNIKNGMDSVYFAIHQVQNAIDRKNHLDIDACIKDENHSEVFIYHNQVYQRIMKLNDKILLTIKKSQLDILEERIMELMKEAIKFFPYIPYDGFQNVWIIKPVTRHGCGFGINVMNDEKQIMTLVKKNLKAYQYVVQKYIERPLLVYKTKFDIRQYFLLTIDEKFFNVWMYKNSYFKFSSREFGLDDFSESVHLTNHTVQKRFRNGNNRSSKLPPHNMWILKEFLNYLKEIGHGSIWDSKIYPTIIKSLLTIIQASMDGTEFAKNNFHLCGADFMISEDFDPILIEINSSPFIHLSTVSTAIVNRAVVEDLVKVVVDYSENSMNPTGDFEKVWNFEIPKPQEDAARLMISGAALKSYNKPNCQLPLKHRETIILKQESTYNDRNIMKQPRSTCIYGAKHSTPVTSPVRSRNSSIIGSTAEPNSSNNTKPNETAAVVNSRKNSHSKRPIKHVKGAKSAVSVKSLLQKQTANFDVDDNDAKSISNKSWDHRNFIQKNGAVTNNYVGTPVKQQANKKPIDRPKTTDTLSISREPDSNINLKRRMTSRRLHTDMPMGVSANKSYSTTNTSPVMNTIGSKATDSLIFLSKTPTVTNNYTNNGTYKVWIAQNKLNNNHMMREKKRTPTLRKSSVEKKRIKINVAESDTNTINSMQSSSSHSKSLSHGITLAKNKSLLEEARELTCSLEKPTRLSPTRSKSQMQDKFHIKTADVVNDYKRHLKSLKLKIQCNGGIKRNYRNSLTDVIQATQPSHPIKTSASLNMAHKENGSYLKNYQVSKISLNQPRNACYAVTGSDEGPTFNISKRHKLVYNSCTSLKAAKKRRERRKVTEN